MAREKKGGPGAGTGLHAKDRHKRDRKGNIIDWTAPLPPGLVARQAMPQPSSKHKSWFELMENKGKKKKLEFQFTESIVPPPGFEFVPAGNPALTTKCKELSREQEAMIFIVTSTTGRFSRALSTHLNRVGHHIRQSIVEKAREALGANQEPFHEANPSLPEPIPQRQEDIDAQADAAIRDLFPRIPNTDRQMIIQHAFNKSNTKNSEPLVGLAADISLSRRVQLAVLAHIRHTHTRYDQLLRETTYVNARKAVEPVCLDILVKWRGDEETGRDQLDEILCEVVVISDSETEDEDDEEDDESSSDVSFSDDAAERNKTIEQVLLPVVERPTEDQSAPRPAPASRRAHRSKAHVERNSRIARKDRRAAIKSHKGFSRYQAARDKAWHQAIERRRHDDPEVQYSANVNMSDRPVHSNPSPQQPTGFSFGYPTPRNGQDLPEQTRPPGQFYSGWGAPPSRPPIAERERPIHGNGSLPIVAPYGYSLARGGEQRDTSFMPIVGQRAPLHTDPGREQVQAQTLDLKDHLVRSIEPYSPVGSQFPPQFPAQGDSHTGRSVPNNSGTLGEPFAFRQNAAPRYVQVERASGYHVIREQPDFITLSPRHEPDRGQPGSGREQAEPGRLSQPYGSPRGLHGDMPRAIPLGVYQGSWAPQPVVHRDGGMNMNYGQPTLRTEPRPIWIDDTGTVLRSEQRPILVEGDVPRLVSHRPGHAPIQIQDDDDDDFVEIVKVTDKFPRRHEPRPMPADLPRYELPRRELRRYESPLPVDGPGYYASHAGPAPPARIERLVARIEAGDPRHQQYDVVPGTTRGEDKYPVALQRRQERVVGIEYLPTDSIREVRYVERPSAVKHEDMDASRYHRAPPINNGEMDTYQHQRPSAAPMQYERLENQPPNNQAQPRNDRPVHYERRY